MMNQPKHLIKRQVIEIQVQKRADADAIQATISRIYRQQLVPLIDQLCSAVSGPTVRHRIDRLEVDVGVIAVDRLETDLVTKVREGLHQALLTQLNIQATAGDPAHAAAAAHTGLELFAHFVRTGALPWWADARQPRLLATCLDDLLQAEPRALAAVVQTLVRTPDPRQRLILHVGDDYLTALAGLLLPAWQADLVAEVPDWLRLLAANGVATGQGPTALRRLFWAALFEVAALGGPSYPTLAAFYQAVLRRSATAHGVDYRRWLVELQAQAAAAPTQIGRAVQTMLADLVHAAPADAADPTTLHQTLARWPRLAQLLPYLTPARQAALLAALPTLTAAQTATATIPARLQPLLRPLLADPHLPPALRTELRQWLQRSTAAVAPTDSRGAAESGLAATDEFTIDNAGLVILWPFLRTFFAHLGLVTDNTFTDAAAQQRAVGLLQALVGGAHPADECWPEYQVPLNKLLCGLAVDELFDFGPPPTDDEVAACLDLLNAVIAQAPILNGMTPDGFRATFLQRAGLLRAQDGVWLLQVERATYDIVLERFPWRWDWVKLPWMDAPLQVVWGRE